MDGLTAACQAALDSGTAGTRHGAAPHLSILVDEQTLAGAASAPGRQRTAGGPAASSDEAPATGNRPAAGTGPTRDGPAPGPAGAGRLLREHRAAGRPTPGQPAPDGLRHGGPQTAGHPFRWGRPRPGPDSGPCSPPGRSSPWPATPN